MKKKLPESYVRYSTIGIQILVIVLLAVWAGRKLDKWCGTTTPYFTLGLTIAGIIAAMIHLIRQIPKN